MSRESTPRHAQMVRDFGFAVQFNAETPWPFAQLRYPLVKHAIAGYLSLAYTSASTDARAAISSQLS